MQTVTGQDIKVSVGTKVPVPVYQHLALTAHERQTSMSRIMREIIHNWYTQTSVEIKAEGGMERCAQT